MDRQVSTGKTDMDSESLTGRTRLRSGLFGRLVVQVEVNRKYFVDNYCATEDIVWRDARLTDLIVNPVTSLEVLK